MNCAPAFDTGTSKGKGNEMHETHLASLLVLAFRVVALFFFPLGPLSPLSPPSTRASTVRPSVVRSLCLLPPVQTFPPQTPFITKLLDIHHHHHISLLPSFTLRLGLGQLRRVARFLLLDLPQQRRVLLLPLRLAQELEQLPRAHPAPCVCRVGAVGCRGR